MTKDNLKLLDQDEGMRDSYAMIHDELLQVAKKYGFIVDLASSDVVVYLENLYGDYMGIGEMETE